LLFNTSNHNLSHNGLNRKYSEFPEFGAFVCSRLAASMRLRDKQKSAQILELTRQQVSKRGGKPPGHLVLSYIQRNNGIYEAMHSRWPAAESLFRKSLETMPTNATTRYLLGLAQLEAGATGDAITSFHQALLLDPDFKAPYASLGLAWLREGNYEKAASACEAGLARHPVTPHASYNLALARFGIAISLQGESGGGKPTTEVAEEVKRLRQESLQALEAAQESRLQAQLWTEEDEELLATLRGTGRLAWPRGTPARDGWRLWNWRP